MQILCATDLLPKSEAAIDRAGILAGRHCADVTLLHVVPIDRPTDALDESVTELYARLRARSQPPLWRHGPQPTVGLRQGARAACVIEEAERLRAGIIVLGPHRGHDMSRMARETLVAKILTARCCPVLIAQREPDVGYQNALLALDMSSASAAAIRVAEALVLEPSTMSTAVYAYEPEFEEVLLREDVDGPTVIRYHRGWQLEARLALSDLLSAQSTDFGRYRIVVIRGQPKTAILNTLRDIRPDLLILGTRAHGWLRRALLGSVSSAFLYQRNCDVLVVPEGYRAPTSPSLPGTKTGKREESREDNHVRNCRSAWATGPMGESMYRTQMR
jgi:universal stress protein E